MIGLWKEGHEGVYITPTLRHALACAAAGADVVALDAGAWSVVVGTAITHPTSLTSWFCAAL